MKKRTRSPFLHSFMTLVVMLALVLVARSFAPERVQITILGTTDLHGNIKPVVGLLFGKHEAEDRTYGIVCQIAGVFSALGLATLPQGVLHAIAGEIYPNASIDDLDNVVDLMMDCRELLGASPVGSTVLAMIDGHLLEVVSLLAGDAELREQAARALRPLLVDAQSIADVTKRSIDGPSKLALTSFGDALTAKAKTAGLRQAIERCQAALAAAQHGESVGDLLRASSNS